MRADYPWTEWKFREEHPARIRALLLLMSGLLNINLMVYLFFVEFWTHSLVFVDFDTNNVENRHVETVKNLVLFAFLGNTKQRNPICFCLCLLLKHKTGFSTIVFSNLINNLFTLWSQHLTTSSNPRFLLIRRDKAGIFRISKWSNLIF